MPPTAGNTNLATQLSEVSEALGFGKVNPGNPGSRGAGDISYVAQYLDCLDGLGASGRGAHAPGETINLLEYPKLTKRAAIFIYRLTR
jgi:glutamate carboxypeptidase